MGLLGRPPECGHRHGYPGAPTTETSARSGHRVSAGVSNTLVLVTNDDGIDAEGIVQLARALERRGHRVLVVAPATNMSGAGAAIGPIDPEVPVRKVLDLGIEGHAFAVQAPPAMIVVAATGGAFGEVPTAVMSGVNHGVNLGRAILHSGTVGAALTAHNLGLTAVAVSLEPGGDHVAAAEIGVDVFEWAVRASRDRPSLANVNVPASAVRETPVVASHLAAFGAVTAAVTGDVLDFQLTIDPANFLEPGSDGDVVRSGKVSLTWLAGLTTAPVAPVDVTLRPVVSDAV